MCFCPWAAILSIAMSGVMVFGGDGFAQELVSKQLLPSFVASTAETLQPGTLQQELNLDLGLHIEILKGDRRVNVIRQKTVLKPVVEVKDRNNLRPPA